MLHLLSPRHPGLPLLDDDSLLGISALDAFLFRLLCDSAGVLQDCHLALKGVGACVLETLPLLVRFDGVCSLIRVLLTGAVMDQAGSFPLDLLCVAEVKADPLDFVLVHFLDNQADSLVQISELVRAVALLHNVDLLRDLVFDRAEDFGDLVVLPGFLLFLVGVLVVAVGTHVLHLLSRHDCLVLTKVASVGDVHGLDFEDVADAHLLRVLLLLCLFRLLEQIVCLLVVERLGVLRLHIVPLFLLAFLWLRVESRADVVTIQEPWVRFERFL